MNSPTTVYDRRPLVDLTWIENRKRQARKPKPASKGKKGRPSASDKFPTMVEAATSFIESNGFRAHRRRADEIGTSGTSIHQLRQHLNDTVPGLREAYPNLGNSTVARLMEPPNRHRRASKMYKAQVAAKVPTKKNSNRQFNDNSHFFSARVRYALEMASKIGEQALVYSADNKNKLRVGDTTLAVDRRVQLGRFFPTNDSPNYFDHDFPVPGYLLTPSGYLQMEPMPTMDIDQLGRERYRMPTKSTSVIVLRSPHSVMNIAAHLNDLTNHCNIPAAVQRGKRAMVLVVDGGPDVNVNHGINELYYGRFFKDSGLDALLVTSYCPGDSALNPVEHLWGPCTKALTGVYLPSSLPGEDRPPALQAGLTNDEKLAKEHRVFNEAMRRVKDAYWKDVKFAGGVGTEVEPSGSNPHPYGSSYDDDKRTLSLSARQFRQTGIYDEVRFLHQHMDRRIGMVIFTKCTDDQCDHCTSNPPSLSSENMDLFRKFPSPVPSEVHPDHFATFQEAVRLPRTRPCEHLPLYGLKGLGRCDVMGCRYVYTSKKDKREHRLRIHHH